MPRVSKMLGLSIHSPRKCSYALLWNAYSSQASTFNHPAGISYLKRKETSHTTAFYKQHCLLQCWRMHKPIGESPGPPSIQIDSKPSQSTVGLAHQHCTAAPAAHKQNTRVREKALGVRLVWLSTKPPTRAPGGPSTPAPPTIPGRGFPEPLLSHGRREASSSWTISINW